MRKVLLRYFLYTVAIAAGTILLVGLAWVRPESLAFDRQLPGVPVPTSELSPVEMLQNLLLLVCIGMFGWIAVRDRLRRPMAMMFVAIFSCFLVRELDFFLDFYIVDNLWQVLCALILSIALVYTGRNWDRFVQGWRRSWPSPGLAIVIAGVMLLIPYAQLIGHGPLWKGIMGDDYVRIVKVVTEEFVELGAYALITIGCGEFLYAWSRLPRTRKLHGRRRGR